VDLGEATHSVCLHFATFECRRMHTSLAFCTRREQWYVEPVAAFVYPHVLFCPLSDPATEAKGFIS
jgi:hypothetical protein